LAQFEVCIIVILSEDAAITARSILSVSKDAGDAAALTPFDITAMNQHTNRHTEEWLRLALIAVLITVILAGCGSSSNTNTTRVVSATPSAVPLGRLGDVAVIGPVEDVQSVHIVESWSSRDGIGSADYYLVRQDDNLAGQATFEVTERVTQQQVTQQEQIAVPLGEMAKLLQAVAASPVVAFGALARPTASEGHSSRIISFDMKNENVSLDATTEPWLANVNYHDIGMLDSSAPWSAYVTLRPYLKSNLQYEMMDNLIRRATPVLIASPTPR
jgi:hypothetical protein